jgi:hypothetical protein
MGGMFGGGKEKVVAFGETKEIDGLKTQAEVCLKVGLNKKESSRKPDVRLLFERITPRARIKC